jgi:hypothetical protein
VAYVGNQPSRGAWRKLTDISGSFNGVTTTFTTSVPPGTSEYYVTAGTASQLLISVGGVIQQPDVDYTVNTNSITFTTAPAAGLTFFGVLCGDALNTGTPADGSITTAKLAGGLSVGLTAGSASTAALYFTGDANTGLYSPGADQLAITTGGTGRLTIDASGNVNIDSNTLYVDAANNRVGLGTSSPASKLNVSGTQGNYRVDPDSVSNEIQLLTTVPDNSGFRNYRVRANQIFLETSGSTALTIDTSQRVGIGTTSPSQLLHVNSSSNDSRIYLGNSSALSHSFIGALVGDLYVSSEVAGAVIFRQNATERARIDTSGRLLVGTSTARSNAFSGALATTQPVQFETATASRSSGLSIINNSNAGWEATLLIGAAGGTTIGSNTAVSNTAGLGTIQFVAGTGTNLRPAASVSASMDGGTVSDSSVPGRLVFSTTADGAASPTERMRITSGGLILFGTNAIYGTGLTFNPEQSGAGSAPTLTWNGGFAGTVTVCDFRYNGVTQGTITSTTAAVAYNTTSDYRLKENVVPLTGAADRLKQIPVHRFNFIADPSKIVDGFLAHEAQAVVPECVTGKKDEVDADGNPIYQGIDQSKLVPLLTAALQEALQKIDAMEARLAALEAA